MKEVVCVKLENDMDLILAHKRVMKLCELTGYSLIAQTSIATAISEIARCAIEFGRNAELKLGIAQNGNKKLLMAIVRDSKDFNSRCNDAILYARRLVDDIELTRSPNEFAVTLKQVLNFGNTITDAKLKSFIEYFKSEPPLSPYDELRRKNLLLQELADKLRESENDFRLLTDSMPLMMLSTNSQGVINYCNQWLQNLLGAVPKDLTPKGWQPFIHAEDYNQFAKDLNNALARQTSLQGQYRFFESSSKQYLWHLFSMIPLKNDKEIVVRWIGFIADIHAQKKIEQTLKDNRELKEAQQQLYENQSELQKKIIELNRSNYELEQFAHLASHDLQEPLRKLFFYSDVLRQKYASHIDDYGNSILTSMTSAASRMKELINDLLSYSQLQQQKLQFTEVDLNEVLQEIMRDLDIPIKEKMARIDTETLPVIHGNKMRLTQLFLNLLSNALKYSKSEVPPHVSITSTMHDGIVSIKVRDNGIGFAEEYREKIFGLFERLHSRNQIPGTGIGLSICKKITELHNGTISAVSTPGEYAEFCVTLPVDLKTQPIAHE